MNHNLESPKKSSPKKLLWKDAWVKAIPDSLLLDRDSDRDRLYHANLVLDRTLERDIRNKKFLDLTCGLGDLVYASLTHDTASSRGYDVVRGGWDRFPANLFSCDLEEISKDRYDAVFLYDISYHEDPVGILQTARKILAPDGLLYVKLIPWSSRYGMSDVRILNKAFAHLYFNDHELPKLGLKVSPHKVIKISIYNEWFESAGLSIRTCRITRHPVERVFRTPLMSAKLADLYGCEHPDTDLEIGQVRYTLGAR